MTVIQYSVKAENLQVWLNDEDYLLSNESFSKRITFDVEEIIKHPDYRGYFADIALIKLNDTVNLETSFALVNPVCIPVNNDNDFALLTGTVAGWGKTSSSGDVSSALLKINVPIMSNERCRKESKYGNAIKVTIKM